MRQSKFSTQLLGISGLLSAAGLFALTAVVAVSLFGIGAASAQTVDEIVVTSQKRASGLSVQDIASSVSAVNSEKMELTQSIDLTDIGRLAPNATLHPSATFASTPNFLIRGIGVSGTTRSLDPTVGIVVDGVYIGYPVGANIDVFDRESIEILRGPQGTLLGRNVTGGAVVVRTRRPDGEFRVKTDVTIGDYNRRDLSVSIEGSLIENKVAGKIAVMTRNRDGYWDDNNGGTIVPDETVIAAASSTGIDVDLAGTGDSGSKPDMDLTIIRPMLHFTPSDNLEITLIGEFLRDKSGTANSAVFVNAENPRRSTSFGYTPPSDRYEINHNLMGGNDLEIDTYIAELNYTTDNGVLTAISSYRELTYDSSTDFDGSPFTIFHFPDNHEEQEQISHEIRYAADVSDKLKYVVGASYFDQEYLVGERRLFAAADLAGVVKLQHDSWSIFGELDYMFNDSTKLTLGGRWTDESKSAQFNRIGTCEVDFSSCNEAPLQQQGTFDDFTPKLAVTHYLNDDVNIYASYTRGFRSGTFDARASTDASFLESAPGPENVDSYEIGLKSILMDQKLLLNVAIFQTEYQDIQKAALEPCVIGTVGCDTGRVQRLVNAAEATIEGIEIEAQAYLSEQFSLEGSLGYTDAGFDSWEGFDADGTAGYDPVTDPAAAAALKFERVPELTYTIAANYVMPLEGGSDVQFRASYAYSDEFYNDALNTEVIKTDSHGLLDASISYTNEERGLRLTLFGKNLTDEEYHDFALDNALTSLTWGGAPTTYGLRMTYSFE